MGDTHSISNSERELAVNPNKQIQTKPTTMYLNKPTTVFDKGYDTSPIQQNNDNDDTECIICCEHMEEADIWKLNCGHFFHIKCLQNWFRKGTRTCPVCRTPVQ